MNISIAWAAGIFEGEGSIRKARNGLKVAMTDLDVLEKFQSIVGVGSIRPYKLQRSHHKQGYDWACWKAADVKHVLNLFLPYFGNRRAYHALNALDTIELAP